LIKKGDIKRKKFTLSEANDIERKLGIDFDKIGFNPEE